MTRLRGIRGSADDTDRRIGGEGKSLSRSDLHVIQGGKGNPFRKYSSVSNFQSPLDSPFGEPPSLLVGTITALLGTGAGVLSLLVFFQFWQPESYISQHWLIFVFAGGIIGFFLRLERFRDEGFNPTTSAPEQQ